MRIAIDAMGGDRAPLVNVLGTLRASELLPEHSFILVGKREAILQCAVLLPPSVSIVDAREAIGMDEKPTEALRAKRGASIVVAMELLGSGEADAVVSAGNTGAVIGAAHLHLERLPGIRRPGIGVPFPTRDGRICTLIDAGANPDPKPEDLVQYASMASVYARILFKHPNPAVGLLNVGSEETKGNALVKQTKPLLEEAPINFVGSVEGRDIWNGVCDVVVCDGFTGNAVLKACEGMAYTIVELVKKHTRRRLSWLVGALLCRKLFKAVADVIDCAEYGGAPLLGFNGVCIICHGASDQKAVSNAIRVAIQFLEARINEQIVESFSVKVGRNE